VRSWTLLVEQRNIDGEIVAGQKVRSFHPRAIDLVEPVKRDVGEYLLATGIRSGLLFPKRDGTPWRSHDWKNWCRRVWHAARAGAGIESLPPYDLRHAFASLQIRAGCSIPELAEQMGHSPAMTLGTYAHVIRELKGEPIVSAEEQIERARRELPGRFRDVEAQRGRWLEPGETALQGGWRDPDSNRGHHDFQMCTDYSESRRFAVLSCGSEPISRVRRFPDFAAVCRTLRPTAVAVGPFNLGCWAATSWCCSTTAGVGCRPHRTDRGHRRPGNRNAGAP
jgi:Phage integrase family